MTGVAKQKKHNMLFASDSSETHELRSVWMLPILLQQSKLKSISQRT